MVPRTVRVKAKRPLRRDKTEFISCSCIRRESYLREGGRKGRIEVSSPTCTYILSGTRTQGEFRYQAPVYVHDVTW